MLLMKLLLRLVRLSLVNRKCIWSVVRFKSFIGHEVVRLSVAHCELNPIEMAWAQQVKGYVRDHNCRFTLTEVERIVNEGFGCVIPERWKKLVDHVQRKVEDHYWEHDGLYETMIDPFIIYYPYGRQLWWFIIQLGRYQFMIRRFWFWRRVMLTFFWQAPIGATNLQEIFHVSMQERIYFLSVQFQWIFQRQD